jgi:hypothetical protein
MRKLFGRVDERLFDLAQSTVRSAADSGHHGEEKG